MDLTRIHHNKKNHSYVQLLKHTLHLSQLYSLALSRLVSLLCSQKFLAHLLSPLSHSLIFLHSLPLTGHNHRPWKSSFPQVQILSSTRPRLVIRHTCIIGTCISAGFELQAHSSVTSTCTPYHPLSADIRQTGIFIFLDLLGLRSTCRYSNTVVRAGTRADSSPPHRHHRFGTHAHPSTRIRTIQSCCLCIVFDSFLVKSNCTTVQPWVIN